MGLSACLWTSLKLKRLLQEALSGRHVHRRTLDKILGLLQWLCKLFSFLQVLASASLRKRQQATRNQSQHRTRRLARLGVVPQQQSCVCRQYSRHFHCPGESPSRGRHMALSCKRDLAKIPTSKRIWMRIRTLRPHVASSVHPAERVWSSGFSRAICHRFTSLCRSPQQPLWFWPPADGDFIGIGGFIQWEEGPCTWFSQTWTLDDLAVLGLPLQHPAHRDITCYEALAQLGLMLCLRSVVPFSSLGCSHENPL